LGRRVHDVFASEDGIFRIATVTKIMASYVDPGWKDAVGAASSGDAYRGAARAEAIRTAVRNSIEAKYISGPTLQRRVQEIALSPGFGGEGAEYKLKIMIFAPNHDVSKASEVLSSDKAWEEAKKRADEAYAEVQKDPSKFAALAKDTTKNDDQMFAAEVATSLDLGQRHTRRRRGQDGDQHASCGRPSQEDLAPGILAPIMEPAIGYVVQPTSRARARLRPHAPPPSAPDVDGNPQLRDCCRHVLESSSAVKRRRHGDFPYQLPTEMEEAASSTPVGGVSRLSRTQRLDLQGRGRGDQDRRSIRPSSVVRLAGLGVPADERGEHLGGPERPDRHHAGRGRPSRRRGCGATCSTRSSPKPA
jgi:hypothetical protein